MEVREVMSRGVVSIRPDAPLKEAVRLMTRHAISGLPVVTPDGEVVGVLSETDLLVKEVGEAGIPHRRLDWLLGEPAETKRVRAMISATTAGEAMTAPAITIGPHQDIRAAATVMVKRRVNRLPVVEGGQLVGIVTRADVARTFLRPDDEIATAIREEVLRDILWIEPDSLEVTVTEGVVRLSGTLERRSMIGPLGRLVGRLDGVVRVELRLGWQFDDTELDGRRAYVGARPEQL